jgi:hypothetical protein
MTKNCLTDTYKGSTKFIIDKKLYLQITHSSDFFSKKTPDLILYILFEIVDLNMKSCPILN